MTLETIIKKPNFGFVFYFGLCLECQPVTNSILVKLHPHPQPPKKKNKKTKAKIKQTKQSKTKHLTLPPKKNQFKPICLIFFFKKNCKKCHRNHHFEFIKKKI